MFLKNNSYLDYQVLLVKEVYLCCREVENALTVKQQFIDNDMQTHKLNIVGACHDQIMFHHLTDWLSNPCLLYTSDAADE